MIQRPSCCANPPSTRRRPTTDRLHDGVKDMYKWYYGTDYYPEKHDRKNAIAEIVLTISGCVALYVVWAVVFYLKGGI